VDKPANKMVRITMSWYIECPIIFFIIVLEISGFVRPYGLRLSNSSLGNSVAKASDARVSIIRFTQSICIAFSGESCNKPNRGIYACSVTTESVQTTVSCYQDS